MNLDISTVYFCVSFYMKENMVEKLQFLVQMTEFWAS